MVRGKQTAPPRGEIGRDPQANGAVRTERSAQLNEPGATTASGMGRDLYTGASWREPCSHAFHVNERSASTTAGASSPP